MFIFLPAIANSELELEHGLGNLQLESGDALILESSSASTELAVQVQDENPVLAIPYYWLQPYFALQLTVGVHFDPNASGVFQGPATFDILEESADFELRVPL
jgi:hypothetical protein